MRCMRVCKAQEILRMWATRVTKTQKTYPHDARECEWHETHETQEPGRWCTRPFWAPHLVESFKNCIVNCNAIFLCGSYIDR